MTLKDDLRLSTKLFAIVIVIALVPAAVVMHLGLTVQASMAVMGSMTGTMAILMTGWKVGVRAALVTGIVSGIVTTLDDHALLAAAMFVLIGLLMGATRAADHWAAYTMTPIVAGFALTTPPIHADSPALDALVIAAIIIVSALFAIGVGQLVLRGRSMGHGDALARGHAATYGLVLGILLGVAAFITLHFDFGHTGSWVILTVAIVFQPYVQDGVKMAFERGAGTIGGFLIAIVIGLTISSPVVINAIILVTAFLMVLSKVQGWAYWKYAMTLTVMVVLLTGAHTSIVDTADARLVASLGTILVVLAVTAILTPLGRGYARRHGYDRY